MLLRAVIHPRKSEPALPAETPSCSSRLENVSLSAIQLKTHIKQPIDQSIEPSPQQAIDH
jgi:hypothetical protein